MANYEASSAWEASWWSWLNLGAVHFPAVLPALRQAEL